MIMSRARKAGSGRTEDVPLGIGKHAVLVCTDAERRSKDAEKGKTHRRCSSDNDAPEHDAPRRRRSSRVVPAGTHCKLKAYRLFAYRPCRGSLDHTSVTSSTRGGSPGASSTDLKRWTVPSPVSAHKTSEMAGISGCNLIYGVGKGIMAIS